MPTDRFLTSIMAVAALASSTLTAADGDTRIARWKDDRAAALVLMFDDSTQSQARHVIPELKKRGLTGTFYINPGSGHFAATRSTWETDVVAAGFELGNHTMTHKGAQSREDAEREIAGCHEWIRTTTAGMRWPRLVSWAQPGGCPWTVDQADMVALLAEHHLIKRPDFGGRGASVAFKTGSEYLAHVDQAIRKGAMECIIFHGVGGDWLSAPLPVFIELLDGLAVRGDKLWITGHIAAHQYATERDAATVAVAGKGAGEIRLRLSCTADPAFYDQSLTLMTSVPATWTTCTVTQGERRVEVAADATNAGTIRYEALPGNDLIVISGK